MLKNKRKGLTLIEVILAMLILSVILVTYITIFGQSAIHVSRGKDITKDTFGLQDIMENAMVEGKQSFIEGKLPVDYSIEIFTNPEYKTTIETKEIKTKINENRQYIAYVTNFEIKEPKSPKLDPFRVRIYDKYKTREVFPWKNDEIRLVAEYTVKNDPLIFEKRSRWYGSTVGEKNPIFASDYEVLSEEEKQEPESTSYTKELAAEKVKAKRFYYFEARPYTLAGRMEHFRNDNRILVLNRAGSQVWQDFMEDIYFNRVKKFASNNKEIYLDIMQNPDHPTLNLDWSQNSNPEGALVGVKVPDIYSGKSFIASINFQFDNVALNSSTNLGIGMGLVDKNNTGVIIDLEPFKHTISVRTTHEGKYENNGLIKEFNTKDNSAFEAFKDTNGGLFDWSKGYSLIIQYHGEKLIIQLENEGTISKPLEIDLKDKNMDPKYIGLKSYSNVDYMPDLKYEIYNKYDRNYSSHFYNVEFKELETEKDENFGMFMFGGGLNISATNIFGDNKSIYFNSNLNTDNIKNNGHIKVSNIYVKENLQLPSGSHQLGSKEKPGEIHVGGDFIEKGSRSIYGDIFVGGNFISESSSSSIYGNLHVGKDLYLLNGNMKLYGDIFVGGNFKLKDANIYGKVFVDGDVELGWTPTLSENTKIYYTGKLSHPNNYNIGILNKLVKVSNVDEAKKPQIPVPKYPELKEDSWYRNNGYLYNGSLRDNIKIYADSYTQTNHTNSVENIIIVAKTGNIRIENFGGSTIKGILFAPNGSVHLNGGSFEGLIIAKNGIDYVQGGGSITIKSIDEIINNYKDYPFK